MTAKFETGKTYNTRSACDHTRSCPKERTMRVYLDDSKTTLMSIEPNDIIFLSDDICRVYGDPQRGNRLTVLLEDWCSYFHNEASAIGALVRALYAMGRVNDDEPALSYEDVM